MEIVDFIIYPLIQLFYQNEFEMLVQHWVSEHLLYQQTYHNLFLEPVKELTVSTET